MFNNQCQFKARCHWRKQPGATDEWCCFSVALAMKEAMFSATLIVLVYRAASLMDANNKRINWAIFLSAAHRKLGRSTVSPLEGWKHHCDILCLLDPPEGKGWTGLSIRGCLTPPSLRRLKCTTISRTNRLSSASTRPTPIQSVRRDRQPLTQTTPLPTN